MEHVEELKKIIQQKGECQDKIIQLKEELVNKDSTIAKKEGEVRMLEREKEELEGKLHNLEEENKFIAKK